MQKFKAGFLLTGMLAAVLIVVFSSARRPVVGGRIAGSGERKAAAGIEWMSVEAAAGRLQKEKRPVLIDLYTTWCGWCKQMDRKTYSNKRVAEYLQEKFYTVRIDAETHATINWAGDRKSVV